MKLERSCGEDKGEDLDRESRREPSRLRWNLSRRTTPLHDHVETLDHSY